MNGRTKHHGIRSLGSERGAQVVEFAIILPIFLMLVMGMIDFGRGYFSWIIITNGAREGARAAAVGHELDIVVDHVQRALSGLPRSTDEPSIPPVDLGAAESCPTGVGVDPADWCIGTDNVKGTRGQPVTVRVEYTFQAIVPFFSSLPAATFPLVAESTMRLE